MSTQLRWSADPRQTVIGFNATHLISDVQGVFKNFSASIYTTGYDFGTTQVHFWLNVDSLQTGDAKRDEQLKGPGFFDVRNYHTIKFLSDSSRRLPGFGNYELGGGLTIKGITRPVKLSLHFSGVLRNDFRESISFDVKGQVKRKDWRLDWKNPFMREQSALSEYIQLNCRFCIRKTEMLEPSVKALSRESLPGISYRKAG